MPIPSQKEKGKVNIWGALKFGGMGRVIAILWMVDWHVWLSGKLLVRLMRPAGFADRAVQLAKLVLTNSQAAGRMT